MISSTQHIRDSQVIETMKIINPITKLQVQNMLTIISMARQRLLE